MRMVVVTTRGAEDDGAFTETTGLALDSLQRAACLDGEVVPRVLAERQEDVVSGLLQRENDREGRVIADVFRVRYVARIAYTSDGTMGRPPE